MIEKGNEVQQVLDGSWISLCLDTGHLLIGGTNPAELARQAPSGSAPASQGRGFVGCGEGAVRTAHLQRSGSPGHVPPAWDGGHRRSRHHRASARTRLRRLVHLEQDTILIEEPTDQGPVEDVATSADYLRSVLARTA